MVESSLPPPPDDYREPYEYREITALSEYLTTSAGRRFLLLHGVVLGGALVVIPTDAATLRAVLDRLAADSTLARTAFAVGGFYGLHLITLVLHEHVHRAVERYLGYDSKIAFGFPAAYTYAEEQMMERRHNLLSLSLPLVTISSAAYLLAVTTGSQVANAVFGVLFLLNTAYAIGDVRGLLFLARRPPGTKTWVVFDDDTARTFVYEPEREEPSPDTVPSTT